MKEENAMDKKYGFILKFQDCAENEIEIFSDEDVEGTVIWPSYSQAEPIRLRGVFATHEEAEEAAKNLKVYKAVITYNHGDFIEEEAPINGFGEGGLEEPAYFFSSYDAKSWVDCRTDSMTNEYCDEDEDEDDEVDTITKTTYEIAEIEITDIEIFEIS